MKVELGQNVHILSSVWIDARGKLSLGVNSVVNQKCRLDNRGGIQIGDNVSISPEVHLITADHDVQDPQCRTRRNSIIIGDRVFIGSRATILPGVTIGDGAVIAACACVTKDVLPFTIVAGVPAKQIKVRNTNLEYETRYARHFF